MRYTLFLAAGFATSVSAFALPAPQSGINCDLSALEVCIKPLRAQVFACPDTDVACTCDVVADVVACYGNHCTGEAPPQVDHAIELCNSVGQDVASASSDFASATSRIASATSRAGLGDDGETSTAAEETTTKSLVDTKSTATETAKVTKTTSNDVEETSSAEDEETSAAGGAATSTRRPAAASTTTGVSATQPTGAADSLAVPAIGGLMAAAMGVIVWL